MSHIAPVPVNLITRIFGPKEEDIRISLSRISLGGSLLGLALYYVGTANPQWPLMNQNFMFWVTEIVLILYVCKLIEYDTSRSLDNPFALKWLVVGAIALAARPFYCLVQEALICSQFNSAQQAQLAACINGYQSYYIDANSKLECAGLISADVSNLATGQCSFLLGSTAFSNFVQFAEFFVIIMYILKNVLLFYLSSVLAHVMMLQYEHHTEVAAAKRKADAPPRVVTLSKQPVGHHV